MTGANNIIIIGTLLYNKKIIMIYIVLYNIYNLVQSIEWKKGWVLMSSTPFMPDPIQRKKNTQQLYVD